VVGLAGGGLEVDRVLPVLLDGGVVDAERDAERDGGAALGVGVEPPTETVTVDRLAQLLGSICRQRDDLIAQRLDLAFDLAQLPELRVAVGSPAAAIEDQERRLASDDRAEVRRGTVDARHRRRGDFRPQQERPDRGR
jgi:hypothetical protein